jgi:phosphoserine phosphatase
MNAVIILMSSDNIIISSEILESFKSILSDNDIIIDKTLWIKNNHCVQFYYQALHDLQTMQATLSHFVYPYKIDIAILPAENRLKKLLISDMDSTMISQECIDELADFIGKKSEISAITERAMQGELNFEESLIERVALLKGLAKSTLEQCFTDKITFMAGAKSALDFMNKNAKKTILVSGGFTFFAEKVQNTLGFDTYHANILNFDSDNTLDGTVTLPILGREAKADILQAYAQELNIPLSDCLAVGDGANDLAMIQSAGLGVAFHAKPAVSEAARVAIHFCDLQALIYLQTNTQLSTFLN